jgi:small GTP-binding protein
MRNGNGTEAEEEAWWKSGSILDVAPRINMGKGRMNVSPPGKRPEWELPMVQSFPMQRDFSVMKQPQPERIVRSVEKICILGDPAVGKTSIVRRFARDNFDEQYLTTSGANVLRKNLNIQYPERGVQAKLTIQIWDVTGENRGNLNPAFFRGASGALVVGDAVRLETQLDMWKWIEAFRSVAGNVPVQMVVNKTDIMDRQEFDYLLMDDISREYGCLYTMTSARTSTNVEMAFRMLCDFLVRRRLFGDIGGTRAC